MTPRETPAAPPPPGMTGSVARRATRERPRTGWYVAALVVLAPLIAETVASSNTPAIRFPLVFPVFAVVYGCPALLLRELWTRGRLTGPRLLLWGLGYTAFNEGVVAGVWFKLSPASGKVLVFTASQAGHAAGVNWAVAIGLVVFHTAYSQMIPVTLAQALAGARGRGNDRRPWLGRGGILLCSVLIGFVLLGSLSTKATLKTCAGPALTGCSTGRQIAAVMVVLITVALTLLPRPRRGAVDDERLRRPQGDTLPTPARVQATWRVLIGAAFGIAVFVAFFVLPLNDVPAAAIATDLALLAVVALVAARWCRPGRGDLRGDVLVTLGALLPAMALDLASWRLGQPIAVLIVITLYGYLLFGPRRGAHAPGPTHPSAVPPGGPAGPPPASGGHA